MSQNANTLVCETYTSNNMFDEVSCETYTNRGIVGKTGKSAYDQAVEGGYQGTEEEFEQALASDIATVASNISDVNSVGQSITDVNSVASNLTDISTVANNVSDVNTVAGISSDVTQVAGISNAVQTVSSHDSDVTLVSDNMASVMTTASNISDVNTVAGISADVSTVAGIAADISAVEDIKTDVSAVASNATNITAVANNETNINAVNSNKTNIDAVAGNSTNINAVAGNEANINAVNANKTNIDAVAGNNTNVTTVATNISNVNAAATNMAAIIAAPTAAQNAATSATNAQTWAEGTDTAVTALGGEHSSKGWANRAQELVESIGTVMRYKGSVANYAALQAIQNPTLGDTYNVLDTGSNYTWDGSAWDAIGSVVDLSAYRTAAAQDLIDSGKQATLVSGTNIKTINNTSLLGSGNIALGTLENTATGIHSLTILGTPSAKNYTTNIGYETSVSRGDFSIVLGSNASAAGPACIVIGDTASASGTNTIQIGSGTNINSGTFQVLSYQLLDSSGNIPSGRLINALPTQTGQSGKFLTTDGIDASWSDKPLVNNTTHGLSILGTSSNAYSSTSIGKYANASGMGSIAISDSYGSATASGLYSTCVGGDSSATGTAATAFGSHAKATANYATQIGYGTNSEANSVYASTSTSDNWKLLGSDGTMPAARLNTMTGADGANAGAKGAVPAPAATDNTKFLKGDGTWATVDALPSQTGNQGKYLTTNGTTASWDIPMAGLPMFYATYQPRKLNNASWLRADPYSWHSADVYVSAYAHLADNISGVTAETETIAGTTITFYRLSDEIKVVLPDQETNLDAIYNATGIGYYFVLDTTNRQFKLPRNIYGFTGYRGDVGGYVAESLPQHTHSPVYLTGSSRDVGDPGNLVITAAAESNGIRTITDSSTGNASSSVYQSGAPVQQRATQAYLYFYVGNTVQNETSVDVAEMTEALNGKVDLASGISQSDVDYVIESYVNGTSWYRVYKSGWCEQGGVTGAINGVDATGSVTLLKPYRDTNYTCQVTIIRDSAGAYRDQFLVAFNISTSGFYIYSNWAGSGNGSQNNYGQWFTAGYIS